MLALAVCLLLSLSGHQSYLHGNLFRPVTRRRPHPRSYGVASLPYSSHFHLCIPCSSDCELYQEPSRNFHIVRNLPNMVPDNNALLIGTHDGAFHCDEALAISMLRCVPAFASIQNTYVVRTRNPDIIEKCNIVVDVGSEYDPVTNRYDHHQRSFVDTLDGFSTKLSSAGLIYKHLGRAILASLIKDKCVPSSTDDSNVMLEICYLKLYRSFIEHIDAIDNGVPSSASMDLKCHISTSLSTRVGQLNPRWNQPQNNDIWNEQFNKALTLTRSEFLANADEVLTSWYPARSIVQRAVEKRFGFVDSDGVPIEAADGKIIILDQFCPWKDHLYELEQQSNLSPILYVLYPDMNGTWRIQAVSEVWNSFLSRKALPESWCGLRDAELSEKVGIEGCIFVHGTGFIGGHTTRAGAIAMALKALLS